MKLNNRNFMLPNVDIDGDNDSVASLLTKSCKRNGCRNAIAVRVVVATPGVLEKMSETMPRINPVASDTHRGVFAGIIIIMYTSSNGVAHPKRWILLSTSTCAINNIIVPTMYFIVSVFMSVD